MTTMLKRLLLAAALLWSVPALAQQTPFVRTGATVPLAASNVTANAALGTSSPSVWVCNPGTTLGYINFGDSTVTATSTAGIPLPAGVCGILSSGGTTHIAAILASGTATITATPGTGTLAATGGGGSGSGGAVTLIDGADVTQGAEADPACATDNGTCTVVAILKRIAQRITSAIAAIVQAATDIVAAVNSSIPTGSNTIGAVTAPGAAALALDASIATTNADLGPPGATACATDTGSCSLNALVQRLAQRITTLIAGIPLTASSADIGNVGGRTNVTPTNCGGTITTGGTAQNAHTAQSTLRGMTIANLDTSEVMWMSFTSTAASADTQSYPLAPATATTFAGLSSYTTPLGFGYNTALSVFAATTGHKFTCTRW